MNERTQKRRERIKKLKRYGLKQFNIVVTIDEEIYLKYKELIKIKHHMSISANVAHHIKEFVHKNELQQ